MLARADLRQSALFAARFEYFAQRFLVDGKPWSSVDALEPPAGAVPVADPARVREYWADVLPPGTLPRDYPPHWCGGLCLFAYHRADIGLHVFWRGGFAAKHMRQLAPGELPKPADLAYFEKNQHHALVESVDADARTFDSIDGNQAPGIRRHRGRKLAAVKAFYSLEPLLAAMGAA